MQHAKSFGTAIILLLLCHIGFSQQLRLGNNPYTVEKSAVLELQSNNQGLLFPRIADTLLINVLTPPDGMVIYFVPTKQLLVRANGSWQSLVSAATLNNYWSVNGNSNGAVKKIGNIDNYDLSFVTNNTERLRILANGYIGVGVSNPANPLVVKDTLEIRRTGTLSTLLFTNTAGTGDFRIGGDGGDIFWQGGGGRALQMGSFHTTILAGDRQTGTMPGFVAGTTTPNTGVLVQSQRDVSVPLAIQARSSQTANITEWRNAANVAMSVVDKNGYFGIATTTPSQKLDVNGTIVSSTATYPNFAYNSANRIAFGETYVPPNDTGNVVQYGSGSNSRNMLFAFAKTGVNTSFLGNDGTQMMLGSESTRPITFRIGLNYSAQNIMASGTEYMRITTTGVGIGTTTPGAKLEVASGTANTSGLKFTNLNNASPVTSSSATLGVDASGNVVVASSSSNVRNSHVLVKSASDFPAAVGGVITLVAGTTYEINGTITLTNKIDPNGCYIIGVNGLTDKLVYTPASGELFTGSHGATIKFLTLTAASAGAKLFNVDAASANLNFIVQNCYILGCNNIGLIKGFGGTVYFETVAYFYNTNGITYENNYNVVLSKQLWDKTNSNTYEKLVGTFNIIQINGGDRTMQAVNTPVAIDVSGVTSLVSGEVKMVLFNGTGTNVNGTFSNKWEVESFGLTTEKDDVASGNLYVSATATTVIASANTPVKAAGTTTAVNLFRVTSPVNNRLTYTGTKTKRFLVTGALTVTMPSAFGSYFTVSVAKNGVILTESKQRVRIANSSDQVSVALSCTVSLGTNDYIEVWLENNSGGTDIVLQNLNLAIK